MNEVKLRLQVVFDVKLDKAALREDNLVLIVYENVLMKVLLDVTFCLLMYFALLYCSTIFLHAFNEVNCFTLAFKTVYDQET